MAFGAPVLAQPALLPQLSPLNSATPLPRKAEPQTVFADGGLGDGGDGGDGGKGAGEDGGDGGVGDGGDGGGLGAGVIIGESTLPPLPPPQADKAQRLSARVRGR